MYYQLRNDFQNLASGTFIAYNVNIEYVDMLV